MGLRLLVLDGGLTVASRDGERGSEGGYVSFGKERREEREREREDTKVSELMKLGLMMNAVVVKFVFI